MDAVTSDKVKFFPERYKDGYLAWLGEKRDWCISRQLWWGHRIPVWSALLPEGTSFSTDNPQSLVEPTSDTIAPIAGVTPQWGGRVGWNENTTVKVIPEGTTGRWRMLVSVRPGFDEIEQQLEKDGFTHDTDVLDTWFSSALWPHSTLGWPGPALPEERPDRVAPDWEQMHAFYPTSVLVTNRDIITLWVARMVLTSLFNLQEIPFHHVYIHPKVMDGFGEGMSKSKGNGVDPLDIIERYGTDAMRYGMVKLATETQDSRLPVSNICPQCGKEVPVKQEHMYMRTKKLVCPECKTAFRPGGPWPENDPELTTAKQGSDRFEEGRNFANKMWNATRFVLGNNNLDGYRPGAIDVAALPTEDRWLLSRLATTTKAVTEALEAYKFSDVARLVYDFVWSEFCDWYIEMSKPRLRDPATRLMAQRVLLGALDGILRLVQPIMPFVAESLWHALNEAAPERGMPVPSRAGESVCIAPWPVFPDTWIDAGVESRFARMQELVRGVREVRNRYQVDDKTRLDVAVKCADSVAADFNALAMFIGPLAGIANFTASPTATKPKQAGGVVRPEFEAYVSLAGLIDVAAEIKRLEKQIAEKRKSLEGTKAKLANEKFMSGAPPEVVQQQRDQVTDTEKQIAALEENMRDLEMG